MWPIRLKLGATPPTSAPQAATTDWAGLSLPLAGGPAGYRPFTALHSKGPPFEQGSPSPEPLGSHRFGADIPRTRSIGSHRQLGKTPHPAGQWSCAVWVLPSPAGASHAATTNRVGLPIPPSCGTAPLGAAIPRKRSIGTEHRRGRTRRPPGTWVTPLGAAMPLVRCIGSDHRFGRPPRPNSQRAHTVGGCHRPKALYRK